ncbi:MAG: hypothetical protein GXO77_16630, partial [Calditrichaeota bacterium]|nr:hypothetical protein [Calditrichota bacterium]
YAAQIKRGNFRWAPTAASEIAVVRGSARDMPDNYDIYWGVAPDEPRKLPPTVSYDARSFDDRAQVEFNFTKRVPTERCYFCHSTKIETDTPPLWAREQDVHLKSGLTCVDCHRNGLDHKIIRGYESSPPAAGFTCQGCHSADSDYPGRLGAPIPEHKGLPPVHLKKLTCTACHSGPLPQKTAYLVKTSMAHALGTHNSKRSPEALPHIFAPVYARRNDGKISPNLLLFPAYWGTISGDSLKPLPPSKILPVVRGVVGYIDSAGSGSFPQISDSVLIAVLDTLKTLPDIRGKVVFVSGQTVYSLNKAKQPVTNDRLKPQPYLWQLAHDVRPASQALGAKGCNDCHSPSSPFFFGKIQTDAPLLSSKPGFIPMTRFLDVNRAGAWLFSFSFFFRPWLKLIIVFFTGILISVFVLYAFKGLNQILNTLYRESNDKTQE